MPSIPTAARRCSHCDGFASAVIATGARTADGYRHTITVHCPACRGTGIARPASTVTAGASC